MAVLIAFLILSGSRGPWKLYFPDLLDSTEFVREFAKTDSYEYYVTKDPDTWDKYRYFGAPQEAIDSAYARGVPYFVMFVSPGKYNLTNRLKIKSKNTAIICEDHEQTIFDWGLTRLDVGFCDSTTLDSGYLYVKNLTCIGDSLFYVACIARYLKYVAIENCAFICSTDYSVGVAFWLMDTLRISNVKSIVGAGYGLYIRYVDFTTINEYSFQNCPGSAGIYIRESDRVEITNAVCYNTLWGIYARDVNNINIYNSILKSDHFGAYFYNLPITKINLYNSVISAKSSSAGNASLKMRGGKINAYTSTLTAPDTVCLYAGSADITDTAIFTGCTFRQDSTTMSGLLSPSIYGGGENSSYNSYLEFKDCRFHIYDGMEIDHDFYMEGCDVYYKHNDSTLASKWGAGGTSMFLNHSQKPTSNTLKNNYFRLVKPDVIDGKWDKKCGIFQQRIRYPTNLSLYGNFIFSDSCGIVCESMGAEYIDTTSITITMVDNYFNLNGWFFVDEGVREDTVRIFSKTDFVSYGSFGSAVDTIYRDHSKFGNVYHVDGDVNMHCFNIDSVDSIKGCSPVTLPSGIIIGTSAQLPTTGIIGAGTGSGLDADKLDGKSGDYYIDTASVSDSLNKLRDEMADSSARVVSDSLGTLRPTIRDTFNAAWNDSSPVMEGRLHSATHDSLDALRPTFRDTAIAVRKDIIDMTGGLGRNFFNISIVTYSSQPYCKVDNSQNPGDSMLLYISPTGDGNVNLIKKKMPDSVQIVAGGANSLTDNYVYYRYNAGAPVLFRSATNLLYQSGIKTDSLINIGSFGLGVASVNSVEVFKYDEVRDVNQRAFQKIFHRLRYRTSYETGISITARDKTVAISNGRVLQAEHVIIPATDNRDPHPFIMPVFSDSNYSTWDSLNGFYEYSDGVAIGANHFFWIVIWGSASEDSTLFQLYINIQASTHVYTTAMACEQDRWNMMPTVIPSEFSKTGFLICAVIYSMSRDSVIDLTNGLKYRDLRSFYSGVEVGSPTTDSVQVASWNFTLPPAIHDSITALGLGSMSTQDSDNVAITGGTITGVPPIGASTRIDWLEDFFGGTTTSGQIGEKGWTSELSGTAAEISSPVSSNRFGLIGFTTGITTTGYACVYITSLNFYPILANLTYEIGTSLSVLSDATNEYDFRVGWGDVTNGDFTDGIYFEYDRNTSVNWQYCSASGGVRTKNASAVAVVTSITYFKMVVNSGSSSVEYFVNDVSVGTITTNLPTGANRATAIAHIIKSAGTTTSTGFIDFYHIYSTSPPRP